MQAEGYRGPLAGVRVLELGGVGPVPFAGMMLADMGAEVVRFTRPHAPAAPDSVSLRGRISITASLTEPAGYQLALRLAACSDILIEGFRAGVAERLGLGPEPLLRRRPQLVYGRIVGWGPAGMYASAPGHDINYIGLSGAMSLTRAADGTPIPPPGLAGDFGGGGMVLLAGVLAALHEAARTGIGQVVETSILAGSAILTAPLWGTLAQPGRDGEIARGILSGAAPFYRVYRCADHRYVAVGAYEPDFYAALCRQLGLTGPLWADQFGVESWAQACAVLAAIFATRTREEWAAAFAGTLACVTPVLELAEAASHEHNVASGIFRATPDGTQPSPAPRFSHGPADITERRDASADPASVITRWERQDGGRA